MVVARLRDGGCRAAVRCRAGPRSDNDPEDAGHLAGVADAVTSVVTTRAFTPDELFTAATTGSSTTGSTSTMLPHFGQGKICPIAAALVTRRGLRQVVHWMEKGVTVQER